MTAAGDPTRPMDRDAFLAAFRRSMPCDGEKIDWSSSIHDPELDRVTRAAMRQAIRRLVPGAPEELVDEIETVEEAFGWHATRAPAEAAPVTPPEAAARVRLRPILEPDLVPLYVASCSVEQGFRWRYRGVTPSFQQFMAGLHDGVLAQYVVADAVDGRALGLVCAYNAELELGHVSIGFLRCDAGRGKGEVLEGMIHFIDHLFATWNLRKVYAEVPEFNATGLFDPAAPAAAVEGRLREHCFYDGRWWDQLIVALYREAWRGERDHWNLPVPPAQRG